ncbi:twin-arginine translocase TatA/TatE family subunit [bacterium]|nr:twin-arginine translocase TatA/TatE family subunit [candidate division CSSED10-310 bacterium]
MFGLGFWELVVILLIVLVIFGASRLPKLGGSLGEGIRNFRDSLRGAPNNHSLDDGDDDGEDTP